MDKWQLNGLEWLEGAAPDTEEATSSNLVTPTNFTSAAPNFSGVALFCFNHVSDLLKNGHIEHSTFKAYCYLLRHINDFFGNQGICDLKTESLNAFIHYLNQRHLSSGTVRKTYNLLAMALRHAYVSRLIDWNPTVAVRAPKNRCPPPNPLTRESLQTLKERLAELELTPCVAAAYLALLTGMRRGECCALQWKDISADGMTAHVRHSIGMKQGGTYLKCTKTGNDRDVPIVPELSTILRQLKERQFQECSETGVKFQSRFYVLGKTDGSYLSPYALTKWWGMHAKEWKLVGTQGRTPVFHDLRHTFATVAVRGLDPKTAQSIMGHSNINMTMRYADTEIDQVRRASSVLEF